MAIAAREEPIHPALVEYRQERARSLQNRVADSITTFAGSMWFVYIHVLWFAVDRTFGPHWCRRISRDCPSVRCPPPSSRAFRWRWAIRPSFATRGDMTMLPTGSPLLLFSRIASP